MNKKSSSKIFFLMMVIVASIWLSVALILASLAQQIKSEMDDLVQQVPQQVKVLFVDSVTNTHTKTSVLEVPLDYADMDYTTICYVGENSSLIFFDLPSDKIIINVDKNYYGLPKATVSQVLTIKVSQSTYQMIWPNLVP